MVIEIFTKIASFYFPQEREDTYTVAYENTLEYLNLKSTCRYYEFNNETWLNIFYAIEKALPKFEVRDITLLSCLDRCFILDIVIQADQNIIKVISLFVSIIVPFYSVLYIENGIRNNGPNSQYCSSDLNEHGYKRISDKIDNVLKKFNYSRFYENLNDQKLPNIAFKNKKYGEFTFFDAFFVHEIPNKI